MSYDMTLEEAKKECKDLIEEYLSCSVIGLDMQIDVGFGEKRCEAVSTIIRALEEFELLKENDTVLRLDLTKALKELGLPEDTIIADELVNLIREKYIPKEKIREMLKETDEIWNKENNRARGFTPLMESCEDKMEVLKEILGEEK